MNSQTCNTEQVPTIKTKTAILPHQNTAVEKLISTRVGALFMEMGTGKSRTTIELVARRVTAGKIDHVLWFCPVSLKETIRQEILKHVDDAVNTIHVFNGKTSTDSLPKAFWYIIGIESMSASSRVVLAVAQLITEHSMVIVDESSYIKGHDAMRTLRITKLSEKARYRLVLTGTPISQGVVDLFAQMRFLSPAILGYRSFYSFAANHLEYSEKYPDLIVQSHNLDYIAAKIQPYVYQVTKAECLELPNKLFETRYFRMTGNQQAAYDAAKQEILLDLEELDHWDDWDSIVIFRLFTALQQIVCGFWNRRQRENRRYLPVEHLEFDHYRVAILMETIREIPSNQKVIIWAKFRHDITEIANAITAQYGADSVAHFHGGLNERQRAEQVEHFRSQSSDAARFFLATQSAGGHGLTLNEAHHVIFYNNEFSQAWE